jgi:hypothetical protein
MYPALHDIFKHTSKIRKIFKKFFLETFIEIDAFFFYFFSPKEIKQILNYFAIKSEATAEIKPTTLIKVTHSKDDSDCMQESYQLSFASPNCLCYGQKVTL